MMWPFRPKKAVASDDAVASADQAQRAFIDARAQRLKADELARRFEKAKRQNHFGEAVTKAMERNQ